jgi:hypothetical protein
MFGAKMVDGGPAQGSGQVTALELMTALFV